jgi:hypothetical protein
MALGYGAFFFCGKFAKRVGFRKGHATRRSGYCYFLTQSYTEHTENTKFL